ncbi:MAG: Flp family type IVb pilin [Geminicoccaceae bacterium]
MIARRREPTAASRDVLAQIETLRRAERGSIATEYGLIAALVAIGLIVALTQVRESLLGLPFPTLIAAFTDALS